MLLFFFIIIHHNMMINKNITMYFTYFMGVLWGIGGLTYGLGVRYLGMSLGNSVTLGFCAAFGAIVPSIYYSFNPIEGKVSFVDMLNSPGGRLVLLGVLVCLIGIAISGKAGMMKEKELPEEVSRKSVAEFSLVKGSGFSNTCNFIHQNIGME